MVSRIEERYYLEAHKVKEFLKELDQIASPRVFSTKYNQTIYFNNFEHEVPFDISIKARRHVDYVVGEEFELYPEEEWFFDIKKEVASFGFFVKEKERKKMKLKEILEIVKNIDKIIGGTFFTQPLRPYIFDSYERKHYVIRGDDRFRITIDSNIKYYFFETGLTAKQIGSEDYYRVEIKVLPNELSSLEYKKIRSCLQTLGAEMITSKKDMAYNLLSKYLRKKNNRYVPQSDTEIEAKLSIDKEHQYIFHQIKKDFYDGIIPGFEVDRNFPYTLESGQLHYFINLGDGNYQRITSVGRSKKLTMKENLEIVNDPFGLNCIIKRKEVRKPVDSIPNLSSIKAIYRKRKYFIVKNKKTERNYCILIDKATYNTNELFQMEIEGLLLSPSKEEEIEVVNDIAFITNRLVEMYKCLKPTTLTKWEWIRNL